MKKGVFLILLALFLFMAPDIYAAPVAKGASTITFTAKQMGVAATGEFKRFDGDIQINKKNEGKSGGTLTVYVDSIDAGSDEASTDVKRKTWFDAASFPRAEFVTTAIGAIGKERYKVAGRLTIKGRTREVSAPVTVRNEKNAYVIEGGFTIDRRDFGIGEGVWADTDTVAAEVEIHFKLYVPTTKK